MEEDPKDHDFDQRHDGPFERPSLHLQRPSSKSKEQQPPHMSGAQSLPNSPVGVEPMRMQTTRSTSDKIKSPLPTASPQTSKGGRPSRDFDNRRDGPFGRPSLTMSRRKSSDRSGQIFGLERQFSSPVTTRSEVADEEKHDQAPSDQSPPNTETFHCTTDAAFEPEPPPLNYHLWPRKWTILLFWSLILLDCVAMPLALYFGLRYHTHLSDNTVFSIVTAALGGVSIIEYLLRFWRLFKPNSKCRVIGAKRLYLDWFHWNFTFGWIIIMIELIVGTVQTHPPIRLLSMPVASMMYAFGTELLVVDLLRYFRVPAPVRMSSIPRGSQLRPGIYSIIEDVCAADGGGGTEYREALNRRYEASHMFRAMLRRLGMFWSIGAEGMAVLITILVFTIPGDAAFCVGWSAPFVWAGVWTLATIFYVKKELKLEKTAWAEEVAAKSGA